MREGRHKQLCLFSAETKAGVLLMKNRKKFVVLFIFETKMNRKFGVFTRDHQR